MGKQRVHASLSLWWIEDELRLSVLLQHSVIVIHSHRAVRVPMSRHPDPKDGVVQTIRQYGAPNHDKNHNDEDSSEPHS